MPNFSEAYLVPDPGFCHGSVAEDGNGMIMNDMDGYGVLVVVSGGTQAAGFAPGSLLQ